jgi:hypothetical protein
VPKVRDQLRQETVETRPMPPVDTTRFLQSDIAKWVPAIKAMNLAMQKYA